MNTTTTTKKKGRGNSMGGVKKGKGNCVITIRHRTLILWFLSISIIVVSCSQIYFFTPQPPDEYNDEYDGRRRHGSSRHQQQSVRGGGDNPIIKKTTKGRTGSTTTDKPIYPVAIPSTIAFDATQSRLASFWAPLLNTNKDKTCPEGLITMNNSTPVLQTTATTEVNKTIFMYSLKRCVTEPLQKSIKEWQRIPGYNYELHDNDDVNELFLRNWTHYFPDLHKALFCLPQNGRSSPSKADLWRYLIMWERGGMYSDIDNVPGKDFRTRIPETITDGMLTLLNHNNELNQQLIAVAPKHPFLYILIQYVIKRLLQIEDISTQNTFSITGPKPFRDMFFKFAGKKRILANKITPGIYPTHVAISDELQQRFVDESWMMNRTIEVIDGQVVGYISAQDKQLFYKKSGMIRWKGLKMHESNASCAKFVSRMLMDEWNNTIL